MKVSADHIVQSYLSRTATPNPGNNPAVNPAALYSTQTWGKLRSRMLRILPFFEFYVNLRRAYIHETNGPSEGFVDNYQEVARNAYRFLTSEEAKDRFMELTTQVKNGLHILDNELRTGKVTPSIYRRIVMPLIELIPLVAAERGVFLKTLSVPGYGGWVAFRLMSDKEQQVAELKRNNPELFESYQERRDIAQKLDAKIEKEILDHGLTYKRKNLLGALVNVGQDPITKEEIVYDLDGEVISVDQFIEKRKRNLKERAHLERTFPNDLEGLRAVDDATIESLGGEKGATYIALTDDKVKQKQVTRIYPVKKVNGEDVVVGGRFKGFLVPDLVNRAGRLIEGVAYTFDPKLGRPVPIETKNPDGSLNITVEREPYATLTSDGRIFLKIPTNRDYTAQRNNLKALTKLIPSVEMLPKSWSSSFYFAPKDFGAVRDALGSFTMSQAAVTKIKEHYTSEAKADAALDEGNLRRYSAQAIGNFKDSVQLYRRQKQSLAWLDVRGGSGLVALSTGVGKTAISLASMQRLSKMAEAIADEEQKPNNGRFLYVCESKLKGNLPFEANIFMTAPRELLDKVDIVSYQQFQSARNADPHYAEDYVAVYFDEAQALKSLAAKGHKAVATLNHKRKVLLTASPMERDPKELYILVALSNNVDTTKPEFKKELLAFEKRFCEKVGGRTVGLKADTQAIRDFRVWVKQNLFYADKRDIEEYMLPQLRKKTEVLTMDAQIEGAYRQVAKDISTTLRGLVSKYRDKNRTPEAEDPALEKARITLARQFAELTLLSNMPEKVFPFHDSGQARENPKLARAVDVIDSKVHNGGRTLLFTDSPEFAETCTEHLQSKFPGKAHALCLSDRIEIWMDGQKLKTYRAKSYTDSSGKVWPETEWQMFAIRQVIVPNTVVLTCTLTSAYAVGQNLQAFDTVIHLDRDSWNSETMKQRTARAWRKGQKNTVEEYTMDMVYSQTEHELDATLDQIRGYMQDMESDLFDSVVIQSQTEALGKEWFGMKRMDASFYELNRRMAELALSPYLKRHAKNTQPTDLVET